MNSNELERVEFAENPEPRCPCVLLLDTSGSMSGAPITALNDGIRTFQEHLIQDRLGSLRVEIAVVTFDSDATLVQDFVSAQDFNPPLLTAQGGTNIAMGIHKALDILQTRKTKYRANGLAYYRPWVFMITDAQVGEEDPEVETVARRIREEDSDSKKSVAFFGVGVESVDMNMLSRLVVRTPIKLKGLDFREMFIWLSASMQRVSQSKPDEQVALPPPGWGTIS